MTRTDAMNIFGIKATDSINKEALADIIKNNEWEISIFPYDIKLVKKLSDEIEACKVLMA